MIIIQRQDNHTLNISAACSTCPNSRGLIVEMPGNEFYIIPDYNIEQFTMDVLQLRSVNLIVIHREWHSWPS